ncbi:MAG TPA: S8 family serine peptidase [Candidatus Nitrosotalea sp.]|nr:S8 family serine peptidase [Candidatus Nitrosotalea sp.]
MQQSVASLSPGMAVVPPSATAAQLGLWPRRGASMRVCGVAAKGFARCQAWLRTDIQGLAQANTPAGYAPSDLQTAYGLASDSKANGSAATVAIVDAYDDPKVESDLNVYRAKFGLSACTSGNGCFTEQKFTSQSNSGWAGEISVDVQMVSAICPNCKILLVEAASPSIADLSTAEQYATAHADYVSNSWSGDEGTKTYDNDYKVSCGAITAATGDLGHNLTAQWPAILPTVIGVGGTSLTAVNPRQETAWSGAGSGCSKIYAKPAFQNMNTRCSMRAEADISADADPATGVAIYDSFHQGGWVVFGGTSVAAPMVAAAFALAATSSTDPVESLYSRTSSFNDVTSGNNGFCGAPLCNAGQGWDGPTGLGSPKGIGAF